MRLYRISIILLIVAVMGLVFQNCRLKIALHKAKMDLEFSQIDSNACRAEAGNLSNRLRIQDEEKAAQSRRAQQEYVYARRLEESLLQFEKDRARWRGYAEHQAILHAERQRLIQSGVLIPVGE